MHMIYIDLKLKLYGHILIEKTIHVQLRRWDFAMPVFILGSGLVYNRWL